MAPEEMRKLTFDALQSVKLTLTKESEALRWLSSDYVENIDTQLSLVHSLTYLHDTVLKGGKIVCCGIGKSFKIATKTVATLRSLSINAAELHPAEALHGDLGLLREKDCLIFFTASGNTPELIHLLPHIPDSVPVILLTSSKESKLAQHPQVKSLLFAVLPEHLRETAIHGIPAPTVSATLSLALADAVAISLAEMIEADQLKRKKTFSMKHPGGSIGTDLSHLNDNYNRMDRSSSAASSLPLVDTGSYSSLLSLGQLRDCVRTTSATSSSPDSFSEGSSALKTDLAAAESSKDNSFCRVAKEEFTSWSEVEFLKQVTLYDYIILIADDQTSLSTSAKLRTAYKEACSSIGFTNTSLLLREFQPISPEPLDIEPID